MGGAGDNGTELLGGRYQLLERLGTGGMSVVWRGHDEVLGRQVAIKVLAPQLAPDRAFRHRIRVEAQAAARLCHPHITNVYDYGEAVQGDATLPYVVMELVDGESLASKLGREHAMPWRQAVAACAEVAAALAAAHARGVVHRDVTPANVMLTSTGVKVVDFGISGLVGENDVGPDGNLLGTPGYLAPERLNGGQVSPATDVYAVGLLLYRSLTGRLPWRAATITQMLRAHLHAAPDPIPPVAGLPAEVVELCRRCLAKRGADRPSSEEVAKILASAAGVTMPGLDVAGLEMVVSGGDPGAAGTRSADSTPATISTAPLACPAETGPMPAPIRRRRLRTCWVQRRAEAVMIGVGLLVVSALIWAGADGPPFPGDGRGLAAAPAGLGMAPRTATGCQVGYAVQVDDGERFEAAVTMTNTTGRALANWTLTFAFPGAQRVTSAEAVGWEQRGRDIVLRSAPGAPPVAPGSSAVALLAGSYQGVNTLPIEFHLDGGSCDVAVSGAVGTPARAGGIAARRDPRGGIAAGISGVVSGSTAGAGGAAASGGRGEPLDLLGGAADDEQCAVRQHRLPSGVGELFTRHLHPDHGHPVPGADARLGHLPSHRVGRDQGLGDGEPVVELDEVDHFGGDQVGHPIAHRHLRIDHVAGAD